jgi:uncharacterized protein (TIGR02611 family)
VNEDVAPTENEADSRIGDGFRRLHAYLHRNPITGAITKVVVSMVGLLVIIAGLVMLVAPGPGIVAILLGLAILATEWVWAHHLMHWLRGKATAAADRARAMDPAVRRRRTLLSFLAVALVVGAIVAYVVTYDWPDFAVSAWDWAQGWSSLVPELPGM